MPAETVIEEKAPRAAAPRDRGKAAFGLGRRLLTLREGSVIVITLLVAAYFAATTDAFFTADNFKTLLPYFAPFAILAAGEVFLMINGEIDLSIGAVYLFAPFMFHEFHVAGLPLLVALALAMVMCLLVGLANGLLTTFLRINSFITTLGMLLILQGAVFLWTGGAPRGALADNFREIGRLGIEDFPVLDQLPWSVLIMLVLGAGAIVLMRRAWGRRLLAVGDNEQAARMSGVRVEDMRTFAFILSGLSAAVAGILLGGFAGVSAQVGQGLEFEAITAVVLGGVALGGGRGTVLAAMAGALTLEALFTLLNLQGVSGALEDTVQGIIIIAAVAFASYRLRGTR